jgi:hypothetical protein
MNKKNPLTLFWQKYNDACFLPENVLTAPLGILILPMDEVEVEHTDPIGTPADDVEDGNANGVAQDPVHGQL